MSDLAARRIDTRNFLFVVFGTLAVFLFTASLWVIDISVAAMRLGSLETYTLLTSYAPVVSYHLGLVLAVGSFMSIVIMFLAAVLLRR